MDEFVISSFDARYYMRAIAGAILFLWVAGYMLYHCLLGNLTHPGIAYGVTAFSCGLVWIYYYFFSKTWKRIKVTPTEIILFDIIFKTQTTIAYAEITRIGTYRARGSETGMRRYGFPQKFVIEFEDDQCVSFSEAWYDNYDKLTMAIYLHKYGPGHGRERYLERHRNTIMSNYNYFQSKKT